MAKITKKFLCNFVWAHWKGQKFKICEKLHDIALREKNNIKKEKVLLIRKSFCNPKTIWAENFRKGYPSSRSVN